MLSSYYYIVIETLHSYFSLRSNCIGPDYLQLNGVEVHDHPIFRELTRVKQYMRKINEAETGPTKNSSNLDKPAAQRFINHALVRTSPCILLLSWGWVAYELNKQFRLGMISMIPSERSNNIKKRLFLEMIKGKLNLVQGGGEKGQLSMTKETTKTLAQGRKGRGGRQIVLDRQPAQVPVPEFPRSHAKSHWKLLQLYIHWTHYCGAR